MSAGPRYQSDGNKDRDRDQQYLYRRGKKKTKAGPVLDDLAKEPGRAGLFGVFGICGKAAKTNVGQMRERHIDRRKEDENEKTYHGDHDLEFHISLIVVGNCLIVNCKGVLVQPFGGIAIGQP